MWQAQYTELPEGAAGRGLSPQWPRLLFVWQAQYTEPPEGAAARIVAAVAARLFFVWQAQYTELPEGAAARIVAGVAAAALCVAGAVHRASVKELRRGLSPQWPRLLFVWQAQYTEPPEGAAARIVAAVAAAGLCVGGGVHRAC